MEENQNKSKLNTIFKLFGPLKPFVKLPIACLVFQVGGGVVPKTVKYRRDLQARFSRGLF